MTLYGYARVSVREPEDKNLDLQVERLVRVGCSLGNIRAEEASGARNDRGGLLELLDLVVVQGLTSRFSYGFPIFWVQLPFLLPLRFFPVSVPDIPPVEAASLHTFFLYSTIFFRDFCRSG